MAYYSIGDVAERCGINPVTLRAWQRRYGLLKPQRSEGVWLILPNYARELFHWVESTQ